LLHTIAQTSEVEAKVNPNRIVDNIGSESVAFIGIQCLTLAFSASLLGKTLPVITPLRHMIRHTTQILNWPSGHRNSFCIVQLISRIIIG
jgi:hypothetical protein